MIVAITGIILILFVIGHLLGNLQIFIGPDWINGYSEHLRDLGPLLWLIRIFLLATVIIHIYVTIQLQLKTGVPDLTRISTNAMSKQRLRRVTW